MLFYSLYIVAPIVGALWFVYVLLCSALCPFLFCNHLDGEDGTGCFPLFVFLVSYDCYCSTALLPHAVGLSAVCDCGTN